MILTLVILFIAGATVGEFLNGCIYSLPRGDSIFSAVSHCPDCHNSLGWLDKVPLVSYVALKRKCRRCGGIISIRYPLVELLCGALFVFAGWRFGRTTELLPALLLISTLILIFFVDMDRSIIPGSVVLLVAAIGLATMITISITTSDPDFPSWWEFPVAGVASAFFLMVIALLFPRGMGREEAYLAGMLGFFLGRNVILALFLGFLIGTLTGTVLIFRGRTRIRRQVPFGPFLTAGALVALFFGERLLDLYLGLF